MEALHIGLIPRDGPVFTGEFALQQNISLVDVLSTTLQSALQKLTTNNNNNNNFDSDINKHEAFDVSKNTSESSTQNVHFIDGDMPWSYDISAAPDSTSILHGFDEASLGAFLSRPIKIQSYSWVPGGDKLFETFNPWTDFFQTPSVLEKINHFRNLRCKLRLKVMINGNSFYYGRVLLSYNPYVVDDQVTVNRAFFEQDLIAASNKPHLLIDPCSSEGGEMCLPFIYPENYIDTTSVGWGDSLGRCTLHDFDILQHANGGTDPITVSIFAWAEDVSLLIPTTVEAQSDTTSKVYLDEFGYPTPAPFENQAKSSSSNERTRKRSNMGNSDEFSKDGLISKPATAIAKAAETLIPYVGPYAKATEMLASGIGDLARLFGYSRPQVLSDIEPFVPRYVGNLANSDAPETVTKLSIDSKNELCIDTRTMGLAGADEMTIHSIASRPTFWRQFDWLESKQPDDLLASMSVQPMCINTLVATPVTELHQTALSFASAPFEAWQGTIKFHFKVICSEYHRGRLRLVYNPLTNPVGEVPFNQTYSTIIDIANEREFDYECKWTDLRAWNRCMGVVGATNRTTFSTTTSVTKTEFDNGTLSVYVLNELATPSTATADIKIQVWVSAGDDFAVSIPSNALQNLAYFEQQAEMETGNVVEHGSMAVSSDNSNNPIGGTKIDTYGQIQAPLLSDNNQYLVYQGERIVSFKDLLRRYHYHTSYWPDTVGSNDQYRMYKLEMAGMPYFRGWDPNGIDQGVNSNTLPSPYNFCAMTLLNYLAPAYVCQRGALRHKWIQGAAKPFEADPLMFVARLPSTVNSKFDENADSFGATSSSADKRVELNRLNRSSLAGTQLTPARLNNCLEIEIPFYSAGQRFRPARKLDMVADGDIQGIEVTTEIEPSLAQSPSVPNVRLDHFVSIGEDLTFAMFVGAPIIYFYSDPVPFS